MKAFAVMAKTRWPAAPDVLTAPTKRRLPGMYISSLVWHGLWVQKGTPKAVIAKLNNAVVRNPGRSRRCGNDLPISAKSIAPADQQTPTALAAYHRAEIEKWWPIIKAANIKVEAH